MSSSDKSNKDSFFQIYDPQINVEELMEKLESKFQERNVSKEDLERISRIRFSPYSRQNYREFDPSLSANLFEKGISVPKFTNPRLWFLRGPLRWFVQKIIEFYALVDKKLSENRVRAFFQVLHELVLLKKKQDILAMKMEEFYQEYAENKFMAAKGMNPRVAYSPLYIRSDFESGVPPESETLLRFLQDAQPVNILYPISLGFLEYCNSIHLDYRVATPYLEDHDLIRRSLTSQVFTIDNIPNSGSILFHANACMFPSAFWEGLLRSWRKLETETRILIRFQEKTNSNLSPFQDQLPLSIQRGDLAEYLKLLGFKNIFIQEPDEFGWTLAIFLHSPR